MTRAGWMGRSRWRHYNTQYMLSRLQKETNVTRTKAGKRKLRLFACGCCRLVWNYLPGPPDDDDAGYTAAAAADMAIGTTRPNAFDAAFDVLTTSFPAPDPKTGDIMIADLLCDIFPNPFRPQPALNPTWLRWHDATIPRLAQRMYDFDANPGLADAPEEAGCTSGDILD